MRPANEEKPMKHAILAAVAILGLVASPGAASDDMRSPSPIGATASILSPADGAEIEGPVTVIFSLDGMGIAPAGVEKANTGHHHLLINRDLPTLDEPLATDDTLIHFGGGQTQAILDLAPGSYSLRLVLGDHNHIPHDPPVISQPVTIRVR